MDIDKLFSDYNSKKKKEEDLRNAQFENEQSFTKAAVKTLVETVKPVLTELDMQLMLKGGSSKVEESLNCARHPRIELHFAPTEGILNQSVLWFRQEKENLFEVRKTIMSNGGRKKQESNKTVQHEDLTKDKVTELANEFITEVFKAS